MAVSRIAALLQFTSRASLFSHVSKKKPVEYFSAIDEETFSYPDEGISCLSPGPERRSDITASVEPPFHCTDLTLVLVFDVPNGMGTSTVSSHPILSPHPTPTHSLSPHSQPSHPLLLSWASLCDANQNHSSLVDKVKLALLSPSLPGLQMDDLGD